MFVVLCPLCKRPLDPAIIGCPKCSSNSVQRSPETLMHDAVNTVAFALLRENGVPDTYVCEKANEVLDDEIIAGALAIQLTNAVRTLFGFKHKTLMDLESDEVESIVEYARRKLG